MAGWILYGLTHAEAKEDGSAGRAVKMFLPASDPTEG
jgi:hypothetical protein